MLRMPARGGAPGAYALVVFASALGVTLGALAPAARGQDRDLAQLLRSGNDADYPHRPMYGPDPAKWPALDREGFKITMELSEKLRGLATPGQMPGKTRAEIRPYDMAYRIATFAAHAHADRVLYKHEGFTEHGPGVGTASLIALIGADGRRTIAVNLSNARRPERAEIALVSPRGLQTPVVAVARDTARLGVFFIPAEQLTSEAGRNASRLRASLDGLTIFDTALDGDFAKRDGFFEAYETAIAKYQALLPPPAPPPLASGSAAPTPTAAVPNSYAEPSPDDMADALIKNEETIGLLRAMMINPTQARRCGFKSYVDGRVPMAEVVPTIRRCLKVRKLGCNRSSRGYICDFRMILGIDGWEEPQDPGKARFFRDETGWAVSGS